MRERDAIEKQLQQSLYDLDRHDKEMDYIHTVHVLVLGTLLDIRDLLQAERTSVVMHTVDVAMDDIEGKIRDVTREELHRDAVASVRIPR